MNPLWKVKNLRKIYELRSQFGAGERIAALDGIDLLIHTGEILGIVGESGCGKTTLGKVLIRLVEPTSGEIFFKETEITSFPERKMRPMRKKFQIIFQDPYSSLNPRISAGAAVLEGIDTDLKRKEKKEKVKQFLNLVGIAEKKFYNFPHQFSGGERQRISIARALSTSPEFVVCDEPTSNLDLSIQAQILNLFVDLKEKLSLTYLFISHDLKVIEFISDRIGVMYKGKMVEIGTSAQIMKNPAHPYTKLLVSSSFFKKKEGTQREEKIVNGCAYASRCPYRKKVCTEETPQLKETEKNHFVSCFLF